jgi:hypothetical protein
VLEVNRPDRQARRRHGRSDPLDAEAAARGVQAGEVTTVPKAGNAIVEMIRSLRVARQTAIKARTQAINALKALLVTAPAELREQLRGRSAAMLVRQAAALDPGPLNTPTAATKLALRCLACRHQAWTPRSPRWTPSSLGWSPRPPPGWSPGSASARLGRRAAGRRQGQPGPAPLRRLLLDAVRVLPDPGVLGQDSPASPQPWW